MLIEGSAEFRGLSEAKASARFKSFGANKKFSVVPQSSAQNIINPKGDNEKVPYAYGKISVLLRHILKAVFLRWGGFNFWVLPLAYGTFSIDALRHQCFARNLAEPRGTFLFGTGRKPLLRSGRGTCRKAPQKKNSQEGNRSGNRGRGSRSRQNKRTAK